MIGARYQRRALVNVRCVESLIVPPKTRHFMTAVQQYERALVFKAGKYRTEKGPGLRFTFPVFHELRKVDMRMQTMQIPSQELMTRDNVTIHVDAVAFFKVCDPMKALCNVTDYAGAVNEAAQTSLRDQLSRANFDEVLHDRDEAGKVILVSLYKITENWGVIVDALKLKNIQIDSTMIRAMGRRAEAERVREARGIEASAEVEASKKLVEAALEFEKAPLGLRLRELQTCTQMAAEANTTILIPTNVSTDVAQALTTLRRQIKAQESSKAKI